MKEYCIQPDASLLECMGAIQRNGAGIAVAVDDSFRLVGTVSDGDIRKALLKGCSLDSSVFPHIERNCFSVLPSVSRAEVLDIMHARRFEQVPVVDEAGKVVGLHLLHDILGNVQRRNWAVVMAGGKGLRLRPATDKIPKPMIKVAGRPILERIVLHLVGFGIRRIFIAVNYMSEVIEGHFGDGSDYGARIEYLREKDPLGSGGAIALLPEVPEEPLLVMNGDLIAETDCADILEFHNKNDFYATMAVYSYFHQVPYGCVEVERDKLTGLEEKPILERLINAGIYVLSPQAVTAVPRDTYFDITSLFEDAIKNGLACGAFATHREWLDIGTPHQLLHARGELG